MSPRDTRTGGVLETMILPALDRGGYAHAQQVDVGIRLGGGRHRIDVLATAKDGQQLLVSLKWQQTSGTAEQKVPYEVICLMDAIKISHGAFAHAYVVLGGDGWKLRDFFVNELDQYIPHNEFVTVMKLESFVAKANKGKL
ncbi:MAG TPA: PD-(D/E)XK nuclease superfamily protein [Candidatus Limnocylindrales bacterium]|nr:PD-(D/E)XK nuclease superfamily protein [Candidatus Limnocylindrales bacterium]